MENAGLKASGVNPDTGLVEIIELENHPFFIGVQYHPEYNLYEVARLIIAREEKLTREGYFRNHQDMLDYVRDLETIYKDPSRKDLRWKYAIDDDLLSDRIRELEFVNWINKIVIPGTK